MQRQAVRGVPWMMLSYASNRLILTTTTVVLARLLGPRDMGIVALAVLAYGAMTSFADLGLGGVLVLRHDLDDRGKGTVLTIMLLMGAITGMAIGILAPFVAAFFGEPRLAAVIRVLVVTLVLGGLTWFYETLLQRELQFRRRFICGFIQTFVNGTVALGLAAWGAGIWSVVFGLLLSWAVYTVAVFSLAPYRVKPAFDRRRARDILATGRGFLAQSALAFFQFNTDYVVVGRVLGAAKLGFYSMAYRLAEQTYHGIASPIAKVTFPAFTRMRHEQQDVTPSFLSALRTVALVACPLGMILSGAAGPFTRAVLGSGWLATISPLSVLGLWAAVRPLHTTIGWLLNSVGQAGVTALVAGVLYAVEVPLLFLVAAHSGITAVAWVLLGHAALSLGLLAVAAARRAGVDLKRQWSAVRPALIASPVTWVVTRGTAEALEHSAPVLALLGSVCAGLLACLAALWLVGPAIIWETGRQIRQALAREPAPPVPEPRLP